MGSIIGALALEDGTATDVGPEEQLYVIKE